jgi:carboxypeptidase family protein
MTAFVSSLALLVGSLHGVVMRGPITPVCQVGKPCDAPAAHVTLRFKGPETTTVKTDANGRYRIRLKAGVYTVTVVPNPQIGRGLEPRTVRVRAAHDTRANFNLDTGIR